jgi:hypothetical protein
MCVESGDEPSLHQFLLSSKETDVANMLYRKLSEQAMKSDTEVISGWLIVALRQILGLENMELPV